jgi:hypothetical protein
MGAAENATRFAAILHSHKQKHRLRVQHNLSRENQPGLFRSRSLIERRQNEKTERFGKRGNPARRKKEKGASAHVNERPP